MPDLPFWNEYIGNASWVIDAGTAERLTLFHLPQVGMEKVVTIDSQRYWLVLRPYKGTEKWILRTAGTQEVM